jgi:hypothetical protein
MQQEQQQLRLDITQTTPVGCECGSKIFHEVMLLRKASRFLHPSLPDDQIIPVQAIACVKCGTLQVDLLPPSLKAMLDNEKDYLDIIEETN